MKTIQVSPTFTYYECEYCGEKERHKSRMRQHEAECEYKYD